MFYRFSNVMFKISRLIG